MGEIVAAVLNVISPNNAPDLWKALQSSSALNQQLGLHHASLPSEAAYLEALAEAYSNATSWDTLQQVLSVMTGVASFRAISEFIPGLTEYRYTVANLHRVQYGQNAPVPPESPQDSRLIQSNWIISWGLLQALILSKTCHLARNTCSCLLGR